MFVFSTASFVLGLPNRVGNCNSSAPEATLGETIGGFENQKDFDRLLQPCFEVHYTA